MALEITWAAMSGPRFYAVWQENGAGFRCGLKILESRQHENHEKHEKRDDVGHEFEDLSNQVIAAALAVHRQLGPGFFEPVYQEAMKVSLAHRFLPFQSQVPVDICFEGVRVAGAQSS